MSEIAELDLRTVSDVTVRELRLTEFGDAAQLLGRGMCDNPANVRVFGISAGERRVQVLARFFAPVLCGLYQRCLLLGAFRDGTLVGACALARPGFCQPTTIENLRLVPAVMFGNPPGTTLRVLRWAGEWARRDPPGPHWHLGPVAVDPPFQGQGIGSSMLSAFCACMDEYGAVSYLETDKSENVRFYRRFGFELATQAEVLGIPNWFMSRLPQIAPARRPTGLPRDDKTPNFTHSPANSSETCGASGAVAPRPPPPASVRLSAIRLEPVRLKLGGPSAA